MFSFIKNSLKSLYATITSKLSTLFASAKIDSATLNQLERILLEADAGVPVTRKLIEQLNDDMAQGRLSSGTDLKNALEHKLITLLQQKEYSSQPAIYVLVGINGSGKTTTVAKLANQLKNSGNKVLLAAGDTFRAAATQQLKTWADKLEVDLVTGKEGQDPASVVFAACQQFKSGDYDKLIIDTAGRLQTKTNLMKELEKIGGIIKKQLPDHTIATLLTIDGMLGQNSLDQARLFNESTSLDGVVLTKMDGTAKGGIVFAIMQELQVPVAYITFGEQIDQIRPFNAQEFVHELVNS